MSDRSLPGRLLTAAAFAAALLAGAPARGQDVICCNLLIGIGGDWIGASRDCAGVLEAASQAQRDLVCEALQPPAVLCPDVEPYCDGAPPSTCDGTEPSKLDPSDHESLGPHVLAQDKPRHGRVQLTIRLDAQHCPLPTGSCVLWAGEEGLIEEGSQEPASRLLFGSIEVRGRKVRVRARIVDVETGVVLDAAKGTATGEPPLAVANALADALAGLDLPCSVARPLQ
jgi:hypothetical protein